MNCLFKKRSICKKTENRQNSVRFGPKYSPGTKNVPKEHLDIVWFFRKFCMNETIVCVLV